MQRRGADDDSLYDDDEQNEHWAAEDRLPFATLVDVDLDGPAAADGLQAGDELLQWGPIWVNEFGTGTGAPALHHESKMCAWPLSHSLGCASKSYLTADSILYWQLSPRPPPL